MFLLRHYLSGLLAILLALGGGGTCTAKDSSPTTGPTAAMPATVPSASNSDTGAGFKTYENTSAHFRFRYPADWTPKPDKDYTLMLVPVAAKPEDPVRHLTADLPSLPPHLPGMITLNRVKDGYIKSQKKKLTDAQVIEDSPQSFPNAKAQRVVVTGKLNGQDRTLAALLLMHDERVYVIRLDCDSSSYSTLKPLWEQMIASLQWTK
jgi:hypothetical protein